MGMNLIWLDKSGKPIKKAMRLNIITNGKIEQGFVLIGKTNQIRFKVALAESIGFIRNERWIVATDADENPIKHFYVLKTDETNVHNGFKMQYQNKSWFISGGTLINDLKLTTPLKCKFELYKDEKYSGLKIFLP